MLLNKLLCWVLLFTLFIGCEGGELLKGNQIVNFDSFSVYDTSWPTACRSGYTGVKVKRQALVHAKTYPAGFAHGYLIHPRGSCTCVAISACTVVTARHCIKSVIVQPSKEKDNRLYIDFFSGSATLTSNWHPQYYRRRISSIIWRTDIRDVALLHLTDPIPTTWKVEINNEDLTPGATIENVGFGVGTEGPVARRKADATLTIVSDAYYFTKSAQQVREGDSGGAALYKGRLLGVHSRLFGEWTAAAARVDNLKHWIDEWTLNP